MLSEDLLAGVLLRNELHRIQNQKLRTSQSLSTFWGCISMPLEPTLHLEVLIYEAQTIQTPLHKQYLAALTLKEDGG